MCDKRNVGLMGYLLANVSTTKMNKRGGKIIMVG